MDAVEEEKDEGLHEIIVRELGYMRTLWGMYTGRMCPASDAWYAPFSYSPATFVDSLHGTTTFVLWTKGLAGWLGGIFSAFVAIEVLKYVRVCV